MVAQKCCNCGKAATMTYEQKRDGKSCKIFYCRDCYKRLFFDKSSPRDEERLTVCPYCGTTAAEALSKKLVGCAYCYDGMKLALMPAIEKLQGGLGLHTGKVPLLEDERALSEEEEVADAQLRAASFKRQRYELQLIIKKLEEEGNYGDALEYKTKLADMEKNAVVGRDFIWRKKRNPNRS